MFLVFARSCVVCLLDLFFAFAFSFVFLGYSGCVFFGVYFHLRVSFLYFGFVCFVCSCSFAFCFYFVSL